MSLFFLFHAFQEISHGIWWYQYIILKAKISQLKIMPAKVTQTLLEIMKIQWDVRKSALISEYNIESLTLCNI